MYKDKIETTFSKSKCPYLKHLSESNTLDLYHCKCELKCVNNVTSSIRFFQESIHEQKGVASKFCIHIIREPGPYKYYNYFDFLQFFEIYQIPRLTFGLDVGCAFYTYLSKAETEIFTTIEKFNDPEGKYKGVIDYWVYFIVNPDWWISTLETRNQLNVYIPKTFGDILKKDNDRTFFEVLVLIKTKHLREVIYRGMKDNVTNYGLKSFHTEYEHLDNEYWNLNIKSLKGTIQPLTRLLFPLDLIKDGIAGR